MKRYLHLLAASSLFAGIKENEIENMLHCLSATVKNYKKGETIYHAGDRIPCVAFVLEGRVHIQKEDYWGNLSILNEIPEGEIFGESYAAPGSETIANHAVAVKDSTVLFLDFNRILTVCTSACQFHTLLIRNLFTVIAAKNRQLAQKIGHMSQRTTREKLLSYLSEQSMRTGRSSFDIPFNRQQLADFLSVDRSAMSNELCKMRDEGLLAFSRNHFTLY